MIKTIIPSKYYFHSKTLHPDTETIHIHNKSLLSSWWDAAGPAPSSLPALQRHPVAGWRLEENTLPSLSPLESAAFNRR